MKLNLSPTELIKIDAVIFNNDGINTKTAAVKFCIANYNNNELLQEVKKLEAENKRLEQILYLLKEETNKIKFNHYKQKKSA